MFLFSYLYIIHLHSSIMKIQIHQNLTSNSQKAFTLQNSKQLGERKQNKILYSKYEALYLAETDKAEFAGKKPKLNKTEENNYLAFKDLRKKGYIVKTGLKFGAEFRIYKPKEKHATHLVIPIKQSSRIDLKDFISKNRTAHSTGKKLLLAVVDNQQDISYYETNWIKI